jgi:hypothetical protein
MALSKERRKIPSKYVYYALELYFSGLSLRKVTKAISVYQKKSCFHLELDPALQAEEDIANKRDANYLNLS